MSMQVVLTYMEYLKWLSMCYRQGKVSDVI